MPFCIQIPRDTKGHLLSDLLSGVNLLSGDLVTFAAEGRTLCLLAVAGAASGHANVVGMAFALLVKGTVRHLAMDVRGLGGATAVSCILKAVRALPKAVAEGIPGMLGIATLHLDVVLAAAAILIVNTGQNSTIQIGH